MEQRKVHYSRAYHLAVFFLNYFEFVKTSYRTNKTHQAFFIKIFPTTAQGGLQTK